LPPFKNSDQYYSLAATGTLRTFCFNQDRYLELKA